MEEEIEILDIKKEGSMKKLSDNFAYWIELDKESYSLINDIKKKLLNNKTNADYILCYRDTNENIGEIYFFHILKYKEHYDEYLTRVFREVFFELFNINKIPVQILEKEIIGNLIYVAIKVFGNGENSIEKELGEEIDLEQIERCLRISLEKHFEYEDIVETTLFQVVSEENF